jgi:hypothetical protein
MSISPISAAADDQDNWGVHKIWGRKTLDSMPAIKGGYILLEWRDVNPQRGQFDFSRVEKELQYYDNLDKNVTIAIRGRYKPDFLFDEVPYYPGPLSKGVGDAKGSLAYWHPNYKKRYAELLTAFAKFLKTSSYRSRVYSIRQNLNAFGTEHTGVPEDKRSVGHWIVPKGVTFLQYSSEENTKYKNFVSQTHYDLFVPDFLVLIRTVLLTGSGSNVPAQVVRAIEDGRVGLVHTSSVPEPTSGSTERKYKQHIEYGKYGSTPVYAEPYSDSSAGPMSGAQWNYWRLLSDLHAGVRYVSVYGSDLEQNSNPEFASAFKFTNQYAGYQTGAAASRSPGAWVALRDGDQYLLGDYTFLMTRMGGDANDAVSSVGPAWQRFGTWARRVNANGQMRFQLDSRFANSLGSGNVLIRVTYFNSNSPKFSIETKGTKRVVSGGSNGTWQTEEISVPAADMTGNTGADLTLRTSTNVVFHMVEVVRNGSQGSSPQVSQARPKAPTSLTVN